MRRNSTFVTGGVPHQSNGSLDMQSYLGEFVEVIKALETSVVDQMAIRLLEAWRSGRTVFCCGNGGSAASASHFIMDLTKLTAPVRGPRLRAMALTENLAAISAISNDICYEEVFAEQLRAFLEPDDVVIGFSTSGSSPNVLRAIDYANRAGAISLGITGCRGVMLEELANHTLVVPSASVQQIEDATMLVGHLLCLRVRELIALDTEEVAAEKSSFTGASLRIGDSLAG